MPRPVRRYSLRGSARKTAEFVGLSLVLGGDLHYRRWPERETSLTRRSRPVTRKGGVRMPEPLTTLPSPHRIRGMPWRPVCRVDYGAGEVV